MNINALVESFYKKADDNEDLINEVLGFLTEMSVRTDAGEKIDIKLPTIKLTENWGKAENKDRERIERYMQNVEGDTMLDKLNSLRAILSGEKTDATVGEVLSTLIATEILSNLAGPIGTRHFTESAAGFIFEGFLAGLFGDTSIQITKPEDIEGMGASGKPITDVILKGKHYSLKLLGDNTAVKGSFKNIVEHFKVLDHVIYLDARRTSDGGLQFGEFIITLENFLEVFYKPFAKFQKKHLEVNTLLKLQNALKKYGDQIYQIKLSKGVRFAAGRRTVVKPEDFPALFELPPEELMELGPFKISYAEQSFAGSKKLRKLFGSARLFNAVHDAIESGDRDAIIASLEALPGYGPNPKQFEFTPKQTESIRNFKELGPPVPLGEGNLKKVWENYAGMLMNTIQPVYGALQDFTDNVDRFFLDSPKKDVSHRHAYGDAAIRDAEELQAATDQAVGAIADPRQLSMFEK